MKILNNLQYRNSKKDTSDFIRPLTQPIQFLSKDKKTEEWGQDNIDWWESIGINIIKSKGKKLLRNIRLAKGIIDKRDYVPDEENEYSDAVNYLMDEEESTAFDLKFFPIIPSVINILKAEFAARVSKIMFVGKDDTSYNEMLEEKRGMIEKTLLATETDKYKQILISAGMDPNSDQFKQEIAPEKIRTLPQIEQFFKKDYQSIIAEWATHQKTADTRKFHLEEMEVAAFESSLTTDSEYWHFKMMEDDFNIELWDPVLSFFIKSPGTDYVSNSSVAGNIDFMTVADAIDNYGYLMNEAQLESMENIAGVHKSYNYDIQGVPSEQKYNMGKSNAWNKEGASSAMRQFTTFMDDFGTRSGDMNDLMGMDNSEFYRQDLMRVTTIYWKTQRKLYHLTKKFDNGKVLQTIVDEDYKITTNPIYDITVYKDKTEKNLINGEHLEGLYINEVWGGVKLGMGRNYTSNTPNYDFSPVYLGIDEKIPSKVKYQFKGDNDLYGCKLPVEGRVFSGKHVKSICLVDLMCPSQINFNLVNNQISDILADEIGPVAMIDQNMLPKHSLGEDWGPHNFAKAYEAMKAFKMLPLDGSIRNMEGTTNFNQSGLLNFDETNRLVSRINLAAHFKNQAMEVVGITPQRMGMIQASETATGVQTATNNSYTQTEMYFTQHSDWLMPRVHSMRTDLAQYYHSKNPSIRLQYITSLDEVAWFKMNTEGLLLKTVGVHCVTEINSRKVLDTLKQFFLTNNTTGASLYDLGSALKAESVAELDRILKTADERVNAQRQAEMAHEQKLLDDKRIAEQQEKDKDRALEKTLNDDDNKKDIIVAKISGARYAVTQDLNNNNNSDYLDIINRVDAQQQADNVMGFKREQEINKNLNLQTQNSLKREEIQSRVEMKRTDLQVAKENKTRDELIAAKKIKATQK